VSKKTGKPEPKPENRETGNRETSSGSGLEKPKTRYPDFWYLVFTELPGTGLNIYFLFLLLLFLVRALHFKI
jgi:hypothetical protein